MKHDSARPLTGPEQSQHGRCEMVRQSREAPWRLAPCWPWVLVACLQERARRAVVLAVIRKWRLALVLVCACGQIHGTVRGLYLEGSALC